jgi:hypothetical protein
METNAMIRLHGYGKDIVIGQTDASKWQPNNSSKDQVILNKYK